MPPTLKKYQALQRKKASFCKGRATKADVKRAAATYIAAAVAKGQTKTEAQKKANKILTKGCSLSSNIAGRRKSAPKKRKPARPRKRRA